MEREAPASNFGLCLQGPTEQVLLYPEKGDISCPRSVVIYLTFSLFTLLLLTIK
jgi:hypothetical protein